MCVCGGGGGVGKSLHKRNTLNIEKGALAVRLPEQRELTYVVEEAGCPWGTECRDWRRSPKRRRAS